MKGDTYSEPKTIVFPGMVARVFSPILTDEEQAKRMKAIHNAAASLLKSMERKTI
jgi:hypothetical protein